MSLKVEDVMVGQVISVSEMATIKEAAELMNLHRIGCLIVVNDGKPIGIVTETDMIKRVIMGSVDPEKTKVCIIMSSPLIMVDPQMNLEEASKIMRKRKIKKLPVVENGHLVGLVTITDIVRSPEVMKMMIKTIKRNIIKELVVFIEEKLGIEK